MLSLDLNQIEGGSILKTTFLFLLVGSLLVCNVGCNRTKLDSGSSSNTNSASDLPSLSSGPLLGKWRNIDNSAHVLEYKPDGTLINNFRENITRDTYYYRSSHQIRVTDASGKVRSPNFTVKGDELTLTWPDAVVETSKSQHFIRVK